MANLGDKINISIEKLSLGGDGISRTDGMVVFTPYVVPGEVIEARIVDQRKTFARAVPTKIIKSGTGRVLPECEHFFTVSHGKWCGGCDYQHLKYSVQLQAKLAAFKETLEKIGGLKPGVNEPLGMAPGEEWRYRNKMQAPFAMLGGKVVAGFYSPGSHDIVPLKDCLIHSESMVSVLHGVLKRMNDWKMEPYSEKSRKGWLRHLVLREELSSGKILVTFVTASEFLPKKDIWVSELRKEFPKIAGICQNINPEKTNVILGRKWRCLSGRDFLTENVCGARLKVSASSFFQVNTKMAERLYGLVRDWAGLGKILLDLYCGVGGIGLLCAPFFEQVFGADEVPSSINDAIENAKINKASNCKFYLKDTRDFLKDLRRTAFDPEMVVVLDPPRAGCSPEVLTHLSKLAPLKIIYVSCDPGTLARDLKILCADKYSVEKVQPVDLFPQSSHLESVTLLKRIR